MSVTTPKMPLHDLHTELGAKTIAFGSFDVPLHYAGGALAEHTHTRVRASIFDLSHLGQFVVTGPERARALEELMPLDAIGLAPGRQRFSLLLTEDGGIQDDLIVANLGDRFFLTVNGARRVPVETLLSEGLAGDVEISALSRAYLALQGPFAESVLAELAPGISDLRFRDVREVAVAGVRCIVSRSGYTGEDGFEISAPADGAEAVARKLLEHPDTSMAGLDARESLRVEAGFPFLGKDIHFYASPVEAGLDWAISPLRRPGAPRAGGFVGAQAVFKQLSDGVGDRLVGLKPVGQTPVRGGSELYLDPQSGEIVGAVTSGIFSPTLGEPIAMGYVPAEIAAVGSRLFADVRGKRLPLDVVERPFVQHQFKR